mgnify:CR=1 FL=1
MLPSRIQAGVFAGQSNRGSLRQSSDLQYSRLSPSGCLVPAGSFCPGTRVSAAKHTALFHNIEERMQIDSRQIHRSCIQYIRIRSLCQLQLIVNAAGRKICSVDIPAKNCRIGKEKAAIHIGRQICRMVAEQLRDRHHLFLGEGSFSD